MEELNKNNRSENRTERQDVHSISVRAGKRTYFFDVKSSRPDQFYLTVTESKKRFDNQTGKFYYEKHKIFLYPEDLIKFSEGMQDAIEKIKALYNGTLPEPGRNHRNQEEEEEERNDYSADVSFEDLD